MAHQHVFWVSMLCASLSCTGSGERRLLSTSAERASEPSDDSAGSHADVTTADRDSIGPANDRARDRARPDADVANRPSAPLVPPISEVVARALLAERFRAAGFRIRYDVPVTRDGQFQITVDGYDPASRVGYEYVATSERDTDLSSDERAALNADPEYRILIVDAASAEIVEDRADRFLRALAPP